MSDKNTDALMLDSAGPTATGFEMKTHAGGPETAKTLLFIADSMRSMLDEHNAPNYLEMELKASDHRHYVMTLQRKGKVTPHAARVAAEAALEAAKPRTIETVAEFGTVYEGAIVRDAEGDIWSIDGGSGKFFMIQAGADDTYPDADVPLPATVLYEPGAGE